MHKLNLKIVTLLGTVFDSDVISATVLTQNGEITILANHTPLVSVIKPGVLSIKNEQGEKRQFKNSNGVLEVRPKSQVIVLLDEAEELK